MRSIYLLAVLIMALGVAYPSHAVRGDTLEVELEAQNDSGISGTAVLRDLGGNRTRIEIRLENDEGNPPHPGHLHEGTCKGTIPTIRYPLKNTVDGKSVTIIEESLDTLTSKEQPLYINLHPSADKLFPVISCGGLSDPSDMPDTGGGATLPGGAVSGLLSAALILGAGGLTALRLLRA